MGGGLFLYPNTFFTRFEPFRPSSPDLNKSWIHLCLHAPLVGPAELCFPRSSAPKAKAGLFLVGSGPLVVRRGRVESHIRNLVGALTITSRFVSIIFQISISMRLFLRAIAGPQPPAFGPKKQNRGRCQPKSSLPCLIAGRNPPWNGPSPPLPENPPPRRQPAGTLLGPPP